MITVIIVVLILVLRHEAKKHPAFAKWAKRVKIFTIVLILLQILLSGSGGWILAIAEIVIGGGLIALIISFFH